MIALLAEVAGRGAVEFGLLPVQTSGSGPEGRLYRLDAEATASLVAGLTGTPPQAGRERARVQVLNGVGGPGIGRAVDERLDGEPLRVVLSGNARDFGHPSTRILVYDDTPPPVAPPSGCVPGSGSVRSNGATSPRAWST